MRSLISPGLAPLKPLSLGLLANRSDRSPGAIDRRTMASPLGLFHCSCLELPQLRSKSNHGGLEKELNKSDPALSNATNATKHMEPLRYCLVETKPRMLTAGNNLRNWEDVAKIVKTMLHSEEGRSLSNYRGLKREVSTLSLLRPAWKTRFTTLMIRKYAPGNMDQEGHNVEISKRIRLF